MATQIAYQGAYLGRQKSEAGPFFAPRTSIPRPFSDATDISDSDHYEHDYEDEDELSYPENSPFTSVASFGAGSVSTASTPNEANTPESTGLTVFDFHIDDKGVRGPNGPHLFRLSSDSSELAHAVDRSALVDQPPSMTVPFYQSASKPEPNRKDTPIPHRSSPTPQPLPQHLPQLQEQPPVQLQSQPQWESVARPASASSAVNVQNWTPTDVVNWLHARGFDDGVIHTFYVNDISGLILLELQSQDLKELGIQSFGKRHMLTSAIQGLRNGTEVPRAQPRASQDNSKYQEIPPTPSTGTTMESGYSSASSATEGDHSRMTASESRGRLLQETLLSRISRDVEPGDSASIVAIEQVLPKLHNCSKGENCRKWQKQQARLAQLAQELPIGTVDGRIIVTGDPGNPATAPRLATTAKSDATPSLLASSDIMGPLPSPGLQLSKANLSEVQPRDPQENVRNFLSFQNVSSPPGETMQTPELGSPEPTKANPTLSENLRHLPKLMIPRSEEDPDMDLTPNWSSQYPHAHPIARSGPYYDQDEDELTAIPRGQPYAYGTAASPGEFYRFDPHYGQSTPLSEMDAPVTALPVDVVSRDESQSVPPNMRFGNNRHMQVGHIGRPASTKPESHRRNNSYNNVPRMMPIETRRGLQPIETPDDLQNTPRLGAHHRHRASSPAGRAPIDVTHSGWMKKRKTTRLLRHEWEDRHFTLEGTHLAMHNDEASARRHSKALEHIDVDDYAVACSSLASSSKLTAAFKKTLLNRKESPVHESAFGFSLVPATNNGRNTVDKKALFLNGSKSHHFAVKTRDERIDWMRELMLAKALKRGREDGAFVNVNGNVI